MARKQKGVIGVVLVAFIQLALMPRAVEWGGQTRRVPILKCEHSNIAHASQKGQEQESAEDIAAGSLFHRAVLQIIVDFIAFVVWILLFIRETRCQQTLFALA